MNLSCAAAAALCTRACLRVELKLECSRVFVHAIRINSSTQQTEAAESGSRLAQLLTARSLRNRRRGVARCACAQPHVCSKEMTGRRA